MKTLPLSAAKARLSRLVEEVRERDEEYTITVHGRPAAVMVSLDEYEGWKETREIRADKPLMREIRKGLRELKAGKSRKYTLEGLLGA